MSEYLNTTRRSVAWFKEVHDSNRLVIKPPFQRNPVWTEAQKSSLIDTILRGYPIPELYMQDLVSSTGKETHIIVDGQQRVRACLEYIEGRFGLDPKEVPERPDLRFEELPEIDRKRIFSYNFIARQLPDASEEELRSIFKRLNRNTIILNRQELRHAAYWGEFITSMENISDLEWWSTAGIFTANDIRRMIDVEYVSELTISYLHGLQNKKSSLDKWYETYEREFPDQKRVSTVFNSVIGELNQILPDISNTRWRKKSDFYTLFLVFASHTNDLPLTKVMRLRATKLLHEFAKAIDSYLSTGNKSDVNVRKYAENVERAASDLKNRRNRAEALEKLLDGLKWK